MSGEVIYDLHDLPAETVQRHASRFVDHVVFLIRPDNQRSRRAVEKIGGALIGTRVRDGRESVAYRISARDWPR